MKLANSDIRPLRGAVLHKCTVCGIKDVWGAGWSWYGSWKLLEDGKPITRCCSEKCRQLAGKPLNWIKE